MNRLGIDQGLNLGEHCGAAAAGDEALTEGFKFGVIREVAHGDTALSKHAHELIGEV